jgi:cytochrome P450
VGVFAPGAFRPERFEPGGEGQGARPRRCLGDGFAIYEMLVNLSRFARRSQCS